MRAAAVVVLVALAVGLSGCDSESTAPTPPPPTPLSVRILQPNTGFTGFDVRVFGEGFSAGATVNMGGVAAPDAVVLNSTQIRLTAPPGITGPVNVVVTNPNGQSATLAGGFTFEFVTLSPSTTLVSPGSEIDVTWTCSIARANFDWIGFFLVGASNFSYESYPWIYTNPGTSGTLTFIAPATPGQYEFRYLLDDGYRDVARSSPITLR